MEGGKIPTTVTSGVLCLITWSSALTSCSCGSVEGGKIPTTATSGVLCLITWSSAVTSCSCTSAEGNAMEAASFFVCSSYILATSFVNVESVKLSIIRRFIGSSFPSEINVFITFFCNISGV